MKKLNKVQINSEKILKNEELLTLRGGYDGVGIKCVGPGVECSGIWVGGSCDNAAYFCDNIGFCNGWEWIVCVG